MVSVSIAFLVACGGKVADQGSPDGGPSGTDTGGRATDISFVEHVCDLVDAAHCGTTYDVARCKRQAPCVLDAYTHDGIVAVANCAARGPCPTDFEGCLVAEAAKIPPTPAVLAFQKACAAAASRCGGAPGAGYCPSGSSPYLPVALFGDPVVTAMTACLSTTSCGSDVDMCVSETVSKSFAACP